MRFSVCADARRTPELKASPPAAADIANMCRRETPCSIVMESSRAVLDVVDRYWRGNDRPSPHAMPARRRSFAAAGLD
jgi:hypothetical protein